MSKPSYATGAGFIVHSSGLRLTRDMAAYALSKHLADSLKPFATDKEREFSRACVDQITEAMKASFPDTPEAPMSENTPKQRRGFACLTPERRREISAKGGASVPASKRSFAKDTSLASTAGRKGGQNGRSAPKMAAE